MTGGRRRATPPPAPLPSRRAGAAPSRVWLAGRRPADPGVVWTIQPMPRNHWPLQTSLPRDNSFAWLVRSACGHPQGLRQWAFYELRDAQIYEAVFRADPCRWARCENYIKIENQRARKG